MKIANCSVDGEQKVSCDAGSSLRRYFDNAPVRRPFAIIQAASLAGRAEAWSSDVFIACFDGCVSNQPRRDTRHERCPTEAQKTMSHRSVSVIRFLFPVS